MRVLSAEEKQGVLALAQETGLSALLLAVAEDWSAQADAAEMEAQAAYDSARLAEAHDLRQLASDLRQVAVNHVAVFDELFGGTEVTNA